jgi:ABC-type bacteriocin/lantibiotic exporter with double-glycine peptidase domain
LVPVARNSGDELVVPSVIHFRQDHYAAIIAKKGDSYEVVDPTFGNRKWLTTSVSALP